MIFVVLCFMPKRRILLDKPRKYKKPTSGLSSKSVKFCFFNSLRIYALAHAAIAEVKGDNLVSRRL